MNSCFANLPILIVMILFFGVSNVSKGQSNCYIRKSDASGLNTNSYQDSLNKYSCLLRDEFPEAYRSQFKVYSYGFYLHKSVTQDKESKLLEIINNFEQEVSLESTYYLLIAKETDSTGVYSNFWVRVKLPEADIFLCLNETQKELISQRIRVAIDDKYTELGRLNIDNYPLAEIAGINELKSVIANISNGVCCETDPNIIYSVLINMGFEGSSCKILPNSGARFPVNVTTERSTTEVLDFAFLDFEEAGNSYDTKNLLSQIITGLVSAELNAKGYITKNENFCDGLFESARLQYSAFSTDFDIWIHLWKNPDYSGDDIIFIKSEKLGEIANYFQAPPVDPPWYPLTKSLLLTHVTTKCPPTIEMHNFIGENVFEETWHHFAATNFSPAFLYTPNTTTFSGGCRNTVPDAVATSFSPITLTAYPSAAWYEVKAANCDVYLSSYENQIRAHIQNLANAQPIACINNGASFNLITTAGMNVGFSVYTFAKGYKIKIIHWEAWYQYNTNGKMEVKFGIKHAFNRLAPSLFPPDFQSYLGYQPVLLLNCD